jgi:hypothetical protein
MTYEPPERLNLTDHFLDARVREGLASRAAVRTDGGDLSYAEVQELASRLVDHLPRAPAGEGEDQRGVLRQPDS